jgi:hypothetical protein
MSTGYSGNAAHDAAVNAAELVRQNSVAAATSQAAVNTATLVFHRAVVASGIKNGCGVEPSMTAIRTLLGATGQ